MYIRNIRPNKSVQSDMPSIQFVKLSAKMIAPNLCKLFKKCVEYGVFPSHLNMLKWYQFTSLVKNEDNNYIIITSHV